MKKLTTEQFIEKANRVHGSRYDYSKVIYINSKDSVIITCSEHGKFTQRADMHLQGQGCPMCAKDIINYKKSKTNTQFIEDAQKVHKDKYSYDYTDYTSSIEKVMITCKIHGNFKQSPNSHLSGDGCPKCGKESHWKRSDYVKKANGRICTFYTIRCFNENESFYKIGITVSSVRRRYNSNRDMPYAYEIISEIHGEAGFIWDLEKEEKRRLKEFQYKPLIEFKGCKTECVTQFKV